jgi:hypothetical protein
MINIYVDRASVRKMIRHMTRQGWKRCVDGNGCPRYAYKGKRDPVAWMVNEKDARCLDEIGISAEHMRWHGHIQVPTQQDVDFLETLQDIHDKDLPPSVMKERILKLCKPYLSPCSSGSDPKGGSRLRRSVLRLRGAPTGS